MEEKEFSTQKTAERGSEDVTPYGQERTTIREKVNRWGSNKGFDGLRLLVIGRILICVFTAMAVYYIIRTISVI